MLPSVGVALLAGIGLASAQGIVDTDLVGTWSSKSNSTMTGSGFYDPVNEKFFEPDHTGISYSFTEDGYYEEAYYRAIANPTDPSCPRGIIQWQHGTYTNYENGSLYLTPIAVDGRQLLSNPCKYSKAIYTRYNQSELMKSYTVSTDAYHNIKRLDLYQFDGSPIMPLYLAYRPPEMLPTTTLNPTTASATAGATATGSSKFKRHLQDGPKLPKNHKVLTKRKNVDDFNADRWWWIGVLLTGTGGLLYFCF